MASTPTPPYFKLDPVPLASIPTSGEALTAFITEVISEATSVILQIADSSWQHYGKKYDVDLYTREREVGGQKEFWAARKSVHELKGGMQWNEWEHSLLFNHAEHEAKYIPSLKKVDKIEMPQLVEPEAPIGQWQNVMVKAYGIHHSLPFPLSPRVFPILIILTQSSTDQEFMVVSIPIDIPADTKNTNGEPILGKTVQGRYCSVERVRTINDGTTVEWLMATASDASGNIPMAMQKRGVPNTIAKDVPSFLTFLEKERSKV